MPGAKIHYGVAFGANTPAHIIPGSGPTTGDEIQKSLWQTFREVHGWIFAGTSNWGLTLAADHQVFSFGPNVIRADMLRGQRYTSAKIVRGGEVTSIHYPPPGHYIFRYSLSSGPGDWKTARLYQAGMDFNNALVPVSVVDNISQKSLPPTHSFCSLRGDNLVVSALKKSGSDSSIVLRLYEIQGLHTQTPVEFLGKQRQFREVNRGCPGIRWR